MTKIKRGAVESLAYTHAAKHYDQEEIGYQSEPAAYIKGFMEAMALIDEKAKEKFIGILSDGYSLRHDTSQYIIQCSGYGDNDFSVFSWNGTHQKDFDDLDKAIAYINRKV